MRSGYITLAFYTMLIIALAVFVHTADAGEIREHKTDETKVLFLGPVIEEDVEMLKTYLTDHPKVTTLAFHSGGGSVSAGMQMMVIIRENELKTVVPNEMVCYSICSFMWLGGTERSVEKLGKLGVHQPFAPHNVAESLGEEQYAYTTMQTVAWMMFMVSDTGIQVDEWWWMMMLNTHPDDMHIFDEEEVALFSK